MKMRKLLNKKNILSLLLLAGTIFSFVQIGRSAPPNPGHGWADIGDSAGDALTVARGGTGGKSFGAGSLLLGNGTGAVQLVAPGTSGNVLTSNGSAWSSAVPASSLTGAVTLLYKDETNSISLNNNSSEIVLKYWVMNVTNTAYSSYILEAIVNGNDGNNANENVTFNWNFKESANVKKSFSWRSVSWTTRNIRIGLQYGGTIKAVLPNTIPNGANLTLTGQKSITNTNITMLVQSFRVYGVK
jgi:hypothetical protein